MTDKERIEVCDCDVIHRDVVESAQKQMPQDEKLFDLAEFFKVFGDSTRIRILWALEDREMCVCDIAYLLNMTQSLILVVIVLMIILSELYNIKTPSIGNGH